MGFENEKYNCRACGTPVYRTAAGQVRQQSDGSHHGHGGDACIRILQQRIRGLEETLANIGTCVGVTSDSPPGERSISVAVHALVALQHADNVEHMRRHIEFMIKVDALVHTLCPSPDDEARATGPLRVVVDTIRGTNGGPQ